MDDDSVRLASELAPIVALALLWLDDATVAEADARLDGPLRAAEEGARKSPPTERVAVRRMYSRLGIDPTRMRPSSEALLRRVRRGERLPRVNSLVDVCNWCSLELQLPYGLYDRDQIDGPVVLRLGRPGEEYAGIGKGVVHLAGRPVLADRRGPFGNPTADSFRTRVTTSTSRALAAIFVPRDAEAALNTAALDLTSTRAAQFSGAREVRRLVV
jgi:DNA/RNA-binding domain of Phe-tRNA-synthetase-like protein